MHAVRRPVIWFVLLSITSLARAETPLSPAFTYQGQLQLGGAPVSGFTDFIFTLWDDRDAAAPINQLGNAIVLDGTAGHAPPLAVADGLFSAQLNTAAEFGPRAFTGAARWLEISVRHPAGTGAYTKLAPRTQLSAAPFALQTRCLSTDSNCRVGIGTSSPLAQLHVVGSLVTQGPYPWVDVRAWGAVGDGVADDTAAFRAALNATPHYGTLFVPSPAVYYRVSGALVVDHPLTVLGNRSEIRQSSSFTSLFVVVSSDVRISGLVLVGTQFELQRSAEFAIQVLGSSLGPPLSGLRIDQNEIRRWGFDAIHLRHMTDFQVTGNNIRDIHYAGITVLSGVRGVISENIIRNMVATPNAYGILLARVEGRDLVTDPRSADIVVANNVVEDVPHWEAYDTHGGERITFVGNTARRTKFGIHVGCSDDDAQEPRFAPLNVTVVGNVVESGVTNGSALPGISFTGAPGPLGAPRERATGAIIGNVIKGHGNAATNVSAAIYVHSTQGLVVSGNTIIEPSPIGINLYNDNQGATVTGNTIVDPWSHDPDMPAVAIAVRSDFNSAQIGGNAFSRAGRAALRVCDEGLRIFNSPGNSVSLGVNQCGCTTYFADGVERIQTELAGIRAIQSSNSQPAAFFSNSAGAGMGLQVRAGAGGSESIVFSAQTYFGIPLLTVRGNGNIGLGTDNPTTRLHVLGAGCATGGWTVCSDERWKANIRPLAAGLNRVEQLRPVQFDWRQAEFPERQFSCESQFGLIAQEVRKVVPEVVTEGSDGYLSVDYGRLTPLLIQALQELRAETKRQQFAYDAELSRCRAEASAERRALRAELDELRAAVRWLSSDEVVKE